MVNGQFRSYNRHEEMKNRLILSVFVRELFFIEEELDGAKTNQILLDGYICKQPVYRKTPLGREIADLLLAVNRPYGKSDYIPCICWGRKTKEESGRGIGGKVACTNAYVDNADLENGFVKAFNRLVTEKG